MFLLFKGSFLTYKVLWRLKWVNVLRVLSGSFIIRKRLYRAL